jgi:hypothetical protein
MVKLRDVSPAKNLKRLEFWVGVRKLLKITVLFMFVGMVECKIAILPINEINNIKQTKENVN